MLAPTRRQDSLSRFSMNSGSERTDTARAVKEEAGGEEGITLKVGEGLGSVEKCGCTVHC